MHYDRGFGVLGFWGSSTCRTMPSCTWHKRSMSRGRRPRQRNYAFCHARPAARCCRPSVGSAPRRWRCWKRRRPARAKRARFCWRWGCCARHSSSSWMSQQTTSTCRRLSVWKRRWSRARRRSCWSVTICGFWHG